MLVHRVKKQDVIVAAERHAEDWDVPWGAVTDFKPLREGWLLRPRCYVLWFEGEHGKGEVWVDPDGTVTSFELDPAGPDHWMVPLWGAYPTYTSVSAGWRQGGGERYYALWFHWFWTLPRPEQQAYQERYPPPEHFVWPDFWDFVGSKLAEASQTDATEEPAEP